MSSGAVSITSAPGEAGSPTGGAILRISSPAVADDANNNQSSNTKNTKGNPSPNSNNAALNWISSLVASVLSISDNKANGHSPSKSKSPSLKTLFHSNASSKKASASPARALVTPPVSTAITPPPSPSASDDTLDHSVSGSSANTEPTSTSSSIPPSVTAPVLLPTKKKTLILDLDETLVHSTIKPVSLYHMTVDVLLEGVHCTFYVIKRPHVDAFLKQVAEWYDLTIFTASMRQYADPLLDQLDKNNNLFQHRLFRESCLYKGGSFIKDLGLIGQDLATTIIVDNSPIAYSHNRENALPIDNWLGDNPKDESLLNLLPFLDALRFTEDVRSILSLRVS